MVVFTRIDDRLIHGQVVEGWVNFLKATLILVADDRVATSALQRSIMEISAPQGLKVLIGTVEEICDQLQDSVPGKERAILLFSTPADVLRALRRGLDCRVLNIGGMHFMPGKRKLIDVVAVDDRDVEALREIAAQGIKVEIQTVPNQKPVPLDKLFKVCQVKKS